MVFNDSFVCIDDVDLVYPKSKILETEYHILYKRWIKRKVRDNVDGEEDENISFDDDSDAELDDCEEGQIDNQADEVGPVWMYKKTLLKKKEHIKGKNCY